MKQYNKILVSKIKEIGNQSASHWLEQMSIETISQESVNISFPNNFISSFVQQNIASVVHELLSDVLERKDFTINYLTREMTNSVQEIVEDASTVQVSKVIKKQRLKKNGLNNKYVFDKYIVGIHNEMAASVSRLIVDQFEKSKEVYNPFIIHSATGLGKSHLVQSIHFDLNKKGIKSIYLTSERFVEMFIESTRQSGKHSFLDNFKEFQTIIIDDIQFFEGKKATQDIFKKLFLHMVNNNKSVILTLDRPIEKLNVMTEGLVDNMSKGLSLEITYPDFLTRIEIIKAKFYQNHKLQLVPDNLITFIASRFDNVNVRVLEGVINKVAFAYKHLNYSLESDKIQKFIEPEVKNEVTYSHVSQVNIKKVVNEVAAYFGVKVSDLQGKSKKREITLPRQIAVYLLKDMLNLSYETIGEYFNRTAVASKYSFSTVEKALDKGDNNIARKISEIREII